LVFLFFIWLLNLGIVKKKCFFLFFRRYPDRLRRVLPDFLAVALADGSGSGSGNGDNGSGSGSGSGGSGIGKNIGATTPYSLGIPRAGGGSGSGSGTGSGGDGGSGSGSGSDADAAIATLHATLLGMLRERRPSADITRAIDTATATATATDSGSGSGSGSGRVAVTDACRVLSRLLLLAGHRTLSNMTRAQQVR
jgi:hypothetical protein